ncbi:MAG: FAD-binding protein [Nannocystaceae bacterium]|nr:FAD-binding protein [bacterium]
MSIFGPRWHNWAHTLDAKPDVLARPRTEEDVQDIVRKAVADGRRVRAGGTGHSWSAGVPTDGVIMLTEHLTRPGSGKPFVDTGGATPVVRVGPGLNQGQLQHVTQPHGLAFPTLGVVYDISLGGFIANGCHGTGWEQPTVSDLVTGMRVVLADGSVREFSQEATPDEMDFARVNLGSIGIITELQFEPVPLCNAHAVDETKPMEALLSRKDPTVLRDQITSSENPYVELFWFPFNTKGSLEGEVWFKHYRPTDEPCDGRIPTRVWDRIQSELGQIPYYEVTLNPKSTPSLMPLLWDLVPTRDEYIAPITDVFHYQHYTFPVTDISFAIPISVGEGGVADFSEANEAWWSFVDAIGKAAERDEYPINVCLHARFIRNSQALLSPSHAPAGSPTHYCYIEGLTFQPRHLETLSPGVRQFHDFFAQMGPRWMELGGVPHWGKDFSAIPSVFEHIRGIYGERLRRWLAWRDGLDPDRVFWNAFMDQIFGGPGL